MLARCPTCRATFSTDRSGQQNCPACGKPLIVPEQPVLAASAPGSSGPQFGSAPSDSPEPPAAGTPWERRPELPLLKAWWETITLLLFEPNKLFSLARIDKVAEQTTFAVATYSVFAIVGQLLERLLIAPQQEQMMARFKELLGDRVPPALMKIFDSNQHPSLGMVVLSYLLAPLIGLIFLYVNVLIAHFFAMIFGQNKKGFGATFTAVAYAMGTSVLLFVPGCGSVVGLVWFAVVTGIGLKRTHGLSAAGATSVVVGPYVLLCCGCCALLSIFGSTAMQALGGKLPMN